MHARPSAPAPPLLLLLILLLLACIAFARPATAQSIAGTVRDADDATPLAGAAVRLRGLGAVAIADEDGRFRFDDVPAGTHRLLVQHAGFADRDAELAIAGDDVLVLDVLLARDAVDLPPITVVARPRKLVAVGFYDRQDRGQGTYITRDEIEGRKVRLLGDLLAQVPGLRRVVDGSGNSSVTLRGTKTVITSCRIQYFIDGVRADLGPLSVDAIPAGDVEGIEVYRGAAQVPSQFDTGRAMCGAVLIWTR